ncbi:MAG: hypothetical protein IKE91_01900 [Clostridia bacterium]|nr:hypothetical protein [Clostridia bacterium]
MTDYSKAYTEVYYAINNFDDNLKAKVPEEFIDYVKSKMDLMYAPIDTEMSEEAKAILSVVYSDYLCEEGEKHTWDELDELFRKQEAVSNQVMVENERPKETVVENKEIAVIEKKSKISRIFDKIKTFFKTIWRK